MCARWLRLRFAAALGAALLFYIPRIASGDQLTPNPNGSLTLNSFSVLSYYYSGSGTPSSPYGKASRPYYAGLGTQPWLTAKFTAVQGFPDEALLTLSTAAWTGSNSTTSITFWASTIQAVLRGSSGSATPMIPATPMVLPCPAAAATTCNTASHMTRPVLLPSGLTGMPPYSQQATPGSMSLTSRKRSIQRILIR